MTWTLVRKGPRKKSRSSSNADDVGVIPQVSSVPQSSVSSVSSVSPAVHSKYPEQRYGGRVTAVDCRNRVAWYLFRQAMTHVDTKVSGANGRSTSQTLYTICRVPLDPSLVESGTRSMRLKRKMKSTKYWRMLWHLQKTPPRLQRKEPCGGLKGMLGGENVKCRLGARLVTNPK